MGTLTLRDHKFDELWYKESPNTSGPFAVDPKYLVLHFTAGSSMSGARSWLCNSKAPGKPSAHLILGKDAKDSAQIVPFDTVAHHAGRSFYQGINGLNQHSIGIEIVNLGPLSQRAADGAWVGAGRKVVDPQEVLVAPHRRGGPIRGWQMYSQEQLDWAEIVVQTLLNNYPSIKEIVGHDDISWPRKVDPGPAFPLDRFKDLINGRSWTPPVRQEEEFKGDFEVTAQKLNVRGGPGTDFETIQAYGPLDKGQNVDLLEDEGNGWYFVELVGGEHAGNRGYVFSRYLARV